MDPQICSVLCFVSVPGLPNKRSGKLDTKQRVDKVLIMNAGVWNGSLDTRMPLRCTHLLCQSLLTSLRARLSSYQMFAISGSRGIRVSKEPFQALAFIMSTLSRV